MQTYLFAAGVLALVIGLVHSVLGEILIFRHLRNRGFVPAMAAPPLQERHIRIIWASWHLVTVFGWAFGAVLLWLAFSSSEQSIHMVTETAIIVASLGGSALVLVGTKGRHPGWVGLLGIALLTWLN